MKYIGVVLLCLTLYKPGYSQVVWQKCSCNPVMVKDDSFFEGLAIGSPSVIIDSGEFKMLYAAGGLDSKGRISLALSADGVTWTKYKNGTPVFEVDTAGSWDSHFLDTPDWLQDGVNYKMYYFGDNDNDPLNSGIGVAVSTDGINWQRIANQPVLTGGAAGEWDELYIESPSVVFDGKMYYMYFSGVDANYKVRIGVATSQDGINWTKYANNPVITEGDLLDWDGFSVATPTVLFKDGKFEMWYSGVSNFDLQDNKIDTVKLGYATSEDGFNWIKSPHNPVLHTYSPPYTSFETRGPWAPSVRYLSASDSYYLWYETAYGFGLAKSGSVVTALDKLETTGDVVDIFPNPTKNIVNIVAVRQMKASIYNLQGRCVLKDIHMNKGHNTVALPLDSGIYTILLETGESFITRKLIVY